MQSIDIAKIIETRGLDFDTVARTLFPENGHPTAALKRLIAGESELHWTHIQYLAYAADLTLVQLLTGQDWEQSVNSHTHTVTAGDYTAKLDRATWTTKLFLKDTIIHETILHDGHIVLSDYLAILDEQIIKIRNEDET